ncbi:MAG: hypothetical protein ACJ72N_06850 [Labedaea sp.]
MAYCGPRGIPLSEFLSWRESDQQAALAWQAYESRRCAGCGSHPDDWDPDLGGDPRAWRAETRICQGCVELQRRHTEPDNQNVRGLHIHLTRR